MNLSALNLFDKLYLFFNTRKTIIWLILLAATWIPFFATDIEWKAISDLSINDDLSAFLIMLFISFLFFIYMIYAYQKKMNFYKNAKITWAKAKIDENTMSYVSGFSKAYRLIGYYKVGNNNYSITTSLVKDLELGKEHEFPVIYHPTNPEKAILLAMLPSFIVNKVVG
ncbi:MAG: hypothetical protein CMO01_04500 [Thalassobius sp.]|nr:hypothetical protein [Thalassovita sp.]